MRLIGSVLAAGAGATAGYMARQLALHQDHPGPEAEMTIGAPLLPTGIGAAVGLLTRNPAIAAAAGFGFAAAAGSRLDGLGPVLQLARERLAPPTTSPHG